MEDRDQAVQEIVDYYQACPSLLLRRAAVGFFQLTQVTCQLASASPEYRKDSLVLKIAQAYNLCSQLLKMYHISESEMKEFADNVLQEQQLQMQLDFTDSPEKQEA